MAALQWVHARPARAGLVGGLILLGAYFLWCALSGEESGLLANFLFPALIVAAAFEMRRDGR